MLLCSKYTRCLLFICCYFIIHQPIVAQIKEIQPLLKDDSTKKVVYFNEAKKSYDQLVANLNGNNVKEYKKIYADRFTTISELITSTRSITNQTADEYLQKIVQKIITANSKLAEKPVRIFFTRDWWPNAFSMGDGTIGINAAIVLYLNNEAELAFIICHELAHYYLDHGNVAISKYVETVNSKEFQAELKKIAKEEYRTNAQLESFTKNLVFNSRRHSRDKEAEADSKGFELFKNSGYVINAAKSSLQILGKMDDSLLYKPLVLEQVFNLPTFAFNNKWVKKESSIFSQAVQTDDLSPKERDSLKTHPDCEKRVVLLNDSLNKYNILGKTFQVDSVKFNQLKNQFFIEIIEETYRQKDMSRHLYYSLLQLQQKSNLPFACHSVAKCLLQIYKLQKDHSLGKYVDKENRFLSKDYNLLLRMLSRISLSELSDLNKAFVANYNQQMKDYEEWQKLAQEINNIN